MFKEVNKNQSKLLSFMKAHPNDATYNIVKLFEIEGEIDPDRIKSAMEKAMDSCEALRTNFVDCGDYYLKQCDMGRLPGVDIIEGLDEKQILECVRRRVNTPFEIDEWPLMELSLFIVNEDKAYLMMVISHLIMDAYSAYLFFERFNRAYKGDEKLEEVGSYVEREIPESRLCEAREFYEQELSEVNGLEMKQLRQSRGENGLLMGKCDSFYLDENLSDEVKEKCKENNISTFSFFAAIYAVILNRVLGEKNIVIGIPFSCRISREERNIIDYMVNTLPICVKVTGGDTVLELAKDISKKLYKIMRFQNVNFDDLKTGYVGAPNNMLTFHKADSFLKINGCVVKDVSVSRDSIMCELQMVVSEEKQAFRIDVQYGDYLSDLPFRDVYEASIKGAVWDMPVADIQIAEKDVIDKTYAVLNSYEKWEDGSTVDELFRAIAGRRSEAAAVSYGKETISYRELDKRSEALACYLRAKYPDVKHVAYSVQKDIDLIVILLGIVKSAKTCVPVDLYNPKERTEYILSNLENVIYICEDIANVNVNCESITKSELLQGMEDYEGQQVNEPLDAENGLYMIYTSGTTGKPKGVVINHRNLLSLISSTREKFHFSEKDSWTLFHSYGFDFSAWEIYGCLLNGGRLVIVPPDVCKSSGDFYRLVADEGITVLNQTPTAFNEFAMVDEREMADLKLRYVIFGGEKLNYFDLDRWVERHTLEDIHLVNMYGITETTIHVTYHEIDSTDMLDGSKSNIGKPLFNLGVYILDENKRILPRGVRGEIAVYGDGLSEGYYKLPELTAERFVELPENQRRVYLSGDLGYLDANGDIIYIDRKDNQIQLRGHRIEKEEIEQVIVKKINADKCVVFVDEGKQKEQRLIAAYSGENDYRELDIKNIIKAFLPAYMIPSRIVHLQSIPRNNNGKVDIKKIKAYVRLNNEMHFSDEVSQKVYTIIKDVTGITEINEDDNLFDIGINSVHLPLVSDQIGKEFSVQFEIMNLFKYTTIDKISSYIKEVS